MPAPMISATVRAAPAAVERAVTTLVDNACKFDESGGPIEVVVQGGAVRVLDRGPGVGDDAEKVFDRFYRAEAARSLPGSGLGLAIVAGMAERAGGSVFALDRQGGGAEVGFVLPAIDPGTSNDWVDDDDAWSTQP